MAMEKIYWRHECVVCHALRVIVHAVYYISKSMTYHFRRLGSQENHLREEVMQFIIVPSVQQ